MAVNPNRRDKSMLVRLTAKELARFVKAANREPLSAWARRNLLAIVERKEKRGSK